ncbi:hypothetical protein C9426_27885, partial [Serratia sp. S1B]
ALRHILQGEGLPLPEQRESVLPSTLRVLVVEDNPVNLRLFGEQLRLLGCRVRLAENGEQALACLQQETFDILLTDLSMPGMDGYTLARRVQAAWPALPVVAVTANATQQEHVKCEAAGMVRVLTKPLRLNTLKEVLIEVCGLMAIYHDVKIEPNIDTKIPLKDEVKQSELLNGNMLPPDIQRLFEQSCADSLMVIKEACLTENEASILRELHYLNGAFGVFDMQELMKQAIYIESQIKKTGLKSASQSLALFCQALDSIASDTSN